MFGEGVGGEVGQVLRKLDGCHLGINALIAGGAGTTDARIAEFFAPVREMERLRTRVKGAGNLERFDYWLNLIQASQFRVRTWVLAARLADKMRAAAALPSADARTSFVRQEVLPLRLDLARSYEALIAAFVDCARSPGEMGTISSIESGSRNRLICNHDSAILQALGQPLPAEASIHTAYQGLPRIFVPASPTQMNVGARQEIRAFVLSRAKCLGVNLYWRPLGEGRFMKLAAVYRARQAYRATLPTPSPRTLEYYLEALLEDGRKVVWPATAPAINQTVIIW
jgi:hypothetical protein